MTPYLLNLADLALTLCALSLGLAEGNPLAAWLIRLHPAVYGAVKIAALPLFLWLDKHGSRWSRRIVTAAYVITVANNIAAIWLTLRRTL